MAKTGLKHIKNKEYVMMDVGQIITYAKQGEELAFTILFDKYYIPLKNFISQSFKTIKREMSEEVDDICMDTFNKAFQRIDSYDSKYKFSTWLYRIGLNSLTDFLRRSRNTIGETSTSQDTGEIRNVQSSDTPEDNLIESQQIESIMESIDTLPDIYKDVMLLYIEGYALDDIADELDISLSNAKVRVKRGKDLLAEMLIDSPLAQKRAKRSKKDAPGKTATTKKNTGNKKPKKGQDK